MRDRISGMLSTNLIVKALFVVIFVLLVGDANLRSENSSGLRGTVVYKVDHVPIRNVYVLVPLWK
jgi:hypothetical protein